MDETQLTDSQDGIRVFVSMDAGLLVLRLINPHPDRLEETVIRLITQREAQGLKAFLS